MLKAILKYTDCLQDGRNVFNTLAIRNIKILKTRQGASTYPKITILIKDYDELNGLVSALNRNCKYEVRVARVKHDNGIFRLIKKLFVNKE